MLLTPLVLLIFTPFQYLGLHPHVFKNTANQAAQYMSTATSVLSSFKSWSGFSQDTPPSPPPVPPKSPVAALPAAEGTGATPLWKKWAAPAALTVLASAAAGTAFYKRDDIGVGYTWVTDHLKYVGNLWNKDELEARLDKLFAIEAQMGVLFHMYARPARLPSHFPGRRS